MKKIIGIGTGPGPSDLLTVRAVEAIKSANYIFAPDNRGKNMALDTAMPYLEGKKIIKLSFPMGESTEKTYDIAYETIVNTLKENQVGVFLNIGDSTIYSTFLNMVNTRSHGEIKIELIPGVPSFVAAANIIKKNLAKKEEDFLLLDHIDDNTVFYADNLAILKTKNIEKTLDLLEKNGYSYDYIENAGHENEFISNDRDEIITRKKYMSLLLARRS